jgi:hypothetical protein
MYYGITKIDDRKTVGHVFTKPVQAEGTRNKIFYLAQSDCLVADRQGQGDVRLTLTPSVSLYLNYVIMVGD